MQKYGVYTRWKWFVVQLYTTHIHREDAMCYVTIYSTLLAIWSRFLLLCRCGLRSSQQNEWKKEKYFESLHHFAPAIFRHHLGHTHTQNNASVLLQNSKLYSLCDCPVTVIVIGIVFGVLIVNPSVNGMIESDGGTSEQQWKLFYTIHPPSTNRTIDSKKQRIQSIHHFRALLPVKWFSVMKTKGTTIDSDDKHTHTRIGSTKWVWMEKNVLLFDEKSNQQHTHTHTRR